MSMLISRLLERILNGPVCPDCPHYLTIHDEIEGCLGAVYDSRGDHSHWCFCKRTAKPARRLSGAVK